MSVIDFPLRNGVPDPLVSGKVLPTLKIALEQSQGKIMDSGFGEGATVAQLPISNGIAKVLRALGHAVPAFDRAFHR